ncbi:hydroxyacylglutathione hydrolase [Capsaspora owczarzaki ATCC 30864]|nr:hydroxyacylglutathione hydrolase [Capsaspora owczarzaki ATCC 30864]|eukprot:XP_004364077.1 hydroxyacylglutathione hydrolase [Capsaspora owczarzaki ATCC 30864]
MQIHTVPILEDNYSYIIVDPSSHAVAVVDPAEPEKVIHALKQLPKSDALNLVAVINTHHHWDHAGENVKFLELAATELNAQGVNVYGGDDRVPKLTHKVTHGETFTLGSIKFTALATPCHTTGSISFRAQSPDGAVDRVVSDESHKPGKWSYVETDVVFTGDTLFVAGCGKFFEGSAANMHHSLIDVLGALPETTRVYCGHEYTVSNLYFAQSVDGANSEVTRALTDAQALRAKGLPTVPSSIGRELAINPFMRVRDPAFCEARAKLAGVASDAITIMGELREAKNRFKRST